MPTGVWPLRTALGTPDDTVLVGTVGNYNRQKGHERFVEAAARLRASDKTLRFCLFGAPTSGRPATTNGRSSHVRSGTG